MKVYVLTINEVYDYEEFNHNPRVFMKREDAIAELNDIKEEAKEEFAEDFDQFDDGENGFEMYADGRYSEGHYSVYVHEVEVEE